MSAPSSDRAGIRQVIRALRKAGYTITGVNIGEGEEPFEPTATEEAILDEATAGDEAHMFVRSPDGQNSFVFFVLGNEPEEVICDHGISLSPVLNPLTESWNNG